MTGTVRTEPSRNVAPALTTEQRQAALAKARDVRQQRVQFLDRVRRGELDLIDVFAFGKQSDIVGTTKLSAVLKAMPGVGEKTAASWMEQVGVPANRRVRGVGPKQQTALARLASEKQAHASS